jgi:branched-chain amino acid transport system ATP-binding protein
MLILEIKNLVKDFEGLRALNGINIDVHEGEIFGVVGPNGSGKSTLFNIITGLVPPTSGQIIYKGESLIGLRPDQIAQRGIGTVFQHNSIFPNLTAKENIIASMHLRTNNDIFGALFNSKGYQRESVRIEEKTIELMRFVGIHERCDLLAKNLPHGNQRELQIAMAMATEPDLLLLDEPATGMNPEETLRLMNLIQSLRQMGMTIVIIEHNMKVIMKMCTQITVINFGEKIAEGTSRQIVSDEQVISVYLGRRKGHAES